MSIVAWDGKTLAADRRMVNNGMPMECRKLWLVWGPESKKYAIAVVGELCTGLGLKEWSEKGEKPEDWPAFQRDKENWTRLVMARDGLCWVYEREPYRIPIQDKFSAWGSGRDFAIAAMHLGKTAAEAVEIASLFDVNCGNGMDVVNLSV